MNKKLGYMISSVFFFIAILWWTIDALLMPDPSSLLYQIVLGFVFFGISFGGGFAMISFFTLDHKNKQDGDQGNV